jgi:hypothetical protein
MPLDSGTINLMNRISAKGPMLPKNLRMIYKGIEVEGDCQTTETEPYSGDGVKVVNDTRASFLDEADVEPTPLDMGDGDVLGMHESPHILVDSTAQLEHVEPVSEKAEVRDENVDALEGRVDVGDHHRDINEAVERTDRYHYPSLVTPSSTLIPSRLWFLSGKLVAERVNNGRPQRDRKPVQRFDPSTYTAVRLDGDHAKQLLPLLERSRAMGALGSHSAHTLTVEKALKSMGAKAEQSIAKELRSMVDKEVFEPVSWEDLLVAQRKKLIRSFMFLKEKLLPEPKLKARFVAGGHMQDRSVYSVDETSSPAVSNSALYIVATIAAYEGRKVRTMDIGSAYLNAEIKREVLMVIQPSLTKFLCSIAPGYSMFMREDGCVVVKLLKALYGCVESSKLWYDDVRKELIKLGFAHNPKDECVFNKVIGGH